MTRWGRHPERRRGLTLLETLVALTILPLAVTGIAYAITAGQAQATESLRRQRAAVLAEALMEEILARPYADPDGASSLGPESGETARGGFDNLDDFHGLVESAGSLRTAGGSLYPAAYQRFSRSVTCTAVTLAVPALQLNRSALQITVTVSDSAGTVLSITRVVPEPA